jgi:protein NrfD
VVADVLALVLLQLAVGLTICNLFAPSKDLSGGFFALHGIIASFALCVAWLVSGNGGFLLRKEERTAAAQAVSTALGARPWFAVALFAVALATLVAHTLVARAGSAVSLTLSKNLLFVSACCGVALLLSRVRVEPFISLPGIGPIWLAAGLLLGALLFGAVVLAMNLGHWYLVSTSLPWGLLVRATEAFALLVVLRAVFAVVALGLVARGSAGEGGEALAGLLDPMRDGFFFWSRVTWGLLAPLVLAPFVVKTARMRSNQAATGLLYVGLVFVLVGELLAAYLTRRSGLPV